MALDIGSHSLTFLQGAEKITDELEEKEGDYAGIIEYTEEVPQTAASIPSGYTKYIISFRPINKKLDFYFLVTGIKDIGGGKVNYATTWKPQSDSLISEVTTTGDLSASLQRFVIWANIIAGYGAVRLSRQERFEAQSAEQFYDDFKLVDEDASANPFDNDKQLVLYRLLDYIKQKVEQEEGADQEQASVIIDEIKLLQASIPNITKTTAIKGLSKIFAKTKAFSLKVIAEFFDIAKKEALKAALYGGLHEADTLFHSFHILP